MAPGAVKTAHWWLSGAADFGHRKGEGLYGVVESLSL
jgi:hypothetical protein